MLTTLCVIAAGVTLVGDVAPAITTTLVIAGAVLAAGLSVLLLWSRPAARPAHPGPAEPVEPVELRPVEPIEPGEPSDDWMSLVEDLLEYVDELETVAARAPGSERQLVSHLVWRTSECLGRAGIDVIDRAAPFDRRLHRVYSGSRPEADQHAVDLVIWPGYALGPRVLRRATVTSEARGGSHG